MEIKNNEGEIKFSAFLEQIEKAGSQRLYYVAIMASLTIPDIGRIIKSSNGEMKRKSYADWFNEYAAPKYRGIGGLCLTGKDCYLLRCSMIHQGKTQHNALQEYTTISFCDFPQSNAPTNPIFLPEDKSLIIEPKTFCSNMVFAAYDWLEVIHNDANFEENMKTFMPFFTLSFPGLSE